MFSLINSARTRLMGSVPTFATLTSSTNSGIMQSIMTRAYKTHQGAAKRWRKMSGGRFKRKQCGRLHGNVGWSKSRNLNHLDGTVLAKGNRRGNQLKKLRRMLPHH